MSYAKIAQMVGRTKQGVANFVWRIRHNAHPTYNITMLDAALETAQPPAAPPLPEVSAADVIKQLERKADDARLEYVRLSTLVRELRAELKL